jgi:hypothetical protein
MYMGHCNPTAFSFTYPNYKPLNGGPAYGLYLESGSMLASYAESNNTPCYVYNLTNSWGNMGPNDNLDWLCLYGCEVLQFSPSNFNPCNTDSSSDFPPSATDAAWNRWGGAFNGLHFMLGFHTDMWYVPTETAGPFAQNMLGTFAIIVVVPPQTIVQAWLNASSATQGNVPCSSSTAPPVVAAAMGPIGPGGVTDMNDYYWGRGSVGPSIPPSDITGWWYIHN